jgi:hypothetical protein
MSLTLYKKEVEDEVSRENFLRIENADRSDALKKAKFRFLQFATLQAVTNLKIAHNLKFVPFDVIMLSVRNSDTTSVVWNYDKFDATSVCVTTNGKCTIRAYVGRYEES